MTRGYIQSTIWESMYRKWKRLITCTLHENSPTSPSGLTSFPSTIVRGDFCHRYMKAWQGTVWNLTMKMMKMTCNLHNSWKQSYTSIWLYIFPLHYRKRWFLMQIHEGLTGQCLKLDDRGEMYYFPSHFSIKVVHTPSYCDAFKDLPQKRPNNAETTKTASRCDQQ